MKIQNIKWKRKGDHIRDIRVICGCGNIIQQNHPLGFFCERCKKGIKKRKVLQIIKREVSQR